MMENDTKKTYGRDLKVKHVPFFVKNIYALRFGKHDNEQRNRFFSGNSYV